MDYRDLTAVVYPSEENGKAEYIGIQVEPFVLYLNKWLALLDDIVEHINSFVEKEKDRLRKVNKSIPDTIEFRGNHCLIEKGWATMYIENENFVVRDLKADDKEYIKMLEESRHWAKGMLKFQDIISDGE